MLTYGMLFHLSVFFIVFHFNAAEGRTVQLIRPPPPRVQGHAPFGIRYFQDPKAHDRTVDDKVILIPLRKSYDYEHERIKMGKQDLGYDDGDYFSSEENDEYELNYTKDNKFEKIADASDTLDDKWLDKFLQIKTDSIPEPPKWATELYGAAPPIETPPWHKWLQRPG